MIYETPLLTLDGNLVGMLQVGAYTEREESLFSFLRSILIFAGLFSIAAAFSLGMLVSRKALRPIGRVTEAAEQIQSGSELGLRIPRETPNDEIGRLTDTLNGMLPRLEVAYNHLEESNTAQRRFVSDASHELRTPLTTIRGNVDLLEKIWTLPPEGSEGHAAHKLPEAERKTMSLEAISDIADEARRMSRLVNDLLSLARADAGYAMEMNTLSLRPLAEEAARRASFLPRHAEWIVARSKRSTAFG
ncbi:sensor histidine kinase [Cohnella faecalis]|uniref:histidine kinase n=1 Tax=Cohnella faecalis TaxID=2315694 RepID=A0A398CRY3_9BACL|nr:HAMP domain-containing sensor histidine kinase [Cohnella faecalis]RIE05313.1 sensor histidine kinase [Cohnella faecalis]